MPADPQPAPAMPDLLEAVNLAKHFAANGVAPTRVIAISLLAALDELSRLRALAGEAAQTIEGCADWIWLDGDDDSIQYADELKGEAARLRAAKDGREGRQ